MVCYPLDLNAPLEEKQLHSSRSVIDVNIIFPNKSINIRYLYSLRTVDEARRKSQLSFSTREYMRIGSFSSTRSQKRGEI